ncbi:MAG: trypsin-like peptidase domain-containing protein [Gemmatimonadota bacterium]
MSVRTLNWLKFGGLVGLAFALGLLFAGLLDLPNRSAAQESTGRSVITPVKAPMLPATKALTDLSDAFASVAEQARPSVVFIRSQHTETAAPHRLPPGMEQFFPHSRHPEVERGSGSGFIVSQDGYILTNNHVVEGAEKVTVRLLDHREFDARVIGTDPATDVAVLKIDAKGLTPAALGNSDDERVGEWVLAIGNPLGDQFTFTVTQGIISAKGRRLDGLSRSNASIADFIQTDAAINPGNSGGPLVNVRGEVIGINSAIASETGTYSGYGFAIPINLARVVMNQIVSTGKVHRAALGIFVEDADANDAAYVGLNEIRGVRVREFPSGDSPAQKAGIEPGDIIISIDGKPVNYTAQLQQIVGFRQPGEIAKVEVARKGGIRKTFDIRLMEQKEEKKLADNTSDQQQQAPHEEHKVTMDKLGIAVTPLSPEVAQEYEISGDVKGLLVTDVQPNGPSADLLSAPDQGGPEIIQSVEGKAVRTEAELREALSHPGPGGVVTLRVYNAQASASRVERIRVQ